MEKHKYSGKTLEDAISKATLDLQEEKDNLIIKTIEEKRTLLTKKVEIEVIEKRNIKDEIKRILLDLLYNMGFKAEIEIQMKEQIPLYRIYSNNDALLIGKNGRNLNALSHIVGQMLKKEIGTNYKFLIDVSDYKENNDKHLEYLAKKLAKEDATTKIEVKMDSMNSYQRRVIHNTLSNHKYVYTESVGEEPNRAVVIKPRED